MEGPLDARRIDYAAAQIIQTLIALQLKKGKKPPSIDKLLLQWDADKPKGSGLELLHKMIVANRMLGGKDERNAKLPTHEPGELEPMTLPRVVR